MCRGVNWTHYKITGLKGNVADLDMQNNSRKTPLYVALTVVVALLATWGRWLWICQFTNTMNFSFNMRQYRWTLQRTLDQNNEPSVGAWRSFRGLQSETASIREDFNTCQPLKFSYCHSVGGDLFILFIAWSGSFLILHEYIRTDFLANSVAFLVSINVLNCRIQVQAHALKTPML